MLGQESDLQLYSFTKASVFNSMTFWMRRLEAFPLRFHRFWLYIMKQCYLETPFLKFCTSVLVFRQKSTRMPKMSLKIIVLLVQQKWTRISSIPIPKFCSFCASSDYQHCAPVVTKTKRWPSGQENHTLVEGRSPCPPPSRKDEARTCQLHIRYWHVALPELADDFEPCEENHLYRTGIQKNWQRHCSRNKTSWKLFETILVKFKNRMQDCCKNRQRRASIGDRKKSNETSTCGYFPHVSVFDFCNHSWGGTAYSCKEHSWKF